MDGCNGTLSMNYLSRIGNLVHCRRIGLDAWVWASSFREDSVRLQVDPWLEMRTVITGPLPDIATRFSRFLGQWWPHDALVIFTRECTGRPRKVAGNREIVDRVTIDELEEVKNSTAFGDSFDGILTLGGGRRRIWAIRDTCDTLLVLVPRPSQTATPHPDQVAAVFGIVAMSIQHQVAQASPDYLAEPRAASSERARTIAELTEVHEATLSSILGTLRSNDLDDRRSRITASETASAALIALILRRRSPPHSPDCRANYAPSCDTAMSTSTTSTSTRRPTADRFLVRWRTRRGRWSAPSSWPSPRNRCCPECGSRGTATATTS
ncbi:hypothetical protein RW1_052_00270 [Rhodococcus wratislaviensis NBRC 100605]|uniref:Uncharacterized protein n=1 Tax=Rhodococcus wratislaviensis NBRC 100605 TaxID=1219028 RepID=X0RBC1_RHOWR|nr:hypothetical protein RW1_052_00270 [Rhodococcus wratislaviensis NBRC 100605]